MRLRVFAAVWMIGVAAPAAGAAQIRDTSFVTSDGVPIHYVMRGQGPALLLLHGFALSAALNWVVPGTLDSLASRFTVIAPDLRGHGHSGKPHDPVAYGARFVDDLVGLLDHLKIRRAHIVGYSMGSGIALKLGVTHPERVRSIVIGGGGWTPPEVPPPAFVFSWFVRLDSAARYHTSVTDALQHPSFPPLPPAMKAAVDSNDAAALLAVLQGFAGMAVTEADLRAIRIPMLVVVGERDDFVRGPAERLAGIVPKASLTLIQGADHVTAIADPRLAIAIRQFARAH